ncbi:spore coat protein [Salibacterium halotolerans]|uniref:Spore Coat Protein X and V domain-containing protein n=1 Tax=Salibacterium halotolerans TaxID=1884432 RepID=A0A1I5XIX1_9BACI|nr:spore coat protein [Salibacterium halotolerans]SFQ31607.1 Spore Coat Protein X and V domain-containing protein [Salibacterium halotolerans]
MSKCKDRDRNRYRKWDRDKDRDKYQDKYRDKYRDKYKDRDQYEDRDQCCEDQDYYEDRDHYGDRDHYEDRDGYRERKRDRRYHRKWNALDPSCSHGGTPSCGSGGETQSAEQSNKTVQASDEYIEVIDSCDVKVSTADTKGALNLQAGLQAALLITISITVFDGDTTKADNFTQELIQSSKIKQVTNQQTYIENSRDVTIETDDTQLALNIQLLLQLLLAIAVIVDIF